MLTPQDIESKTFKRVYIGGYSVEEVEEFLDQVLKDYEALYKENLELKDKIALLNENIQNYKTIEETLQNTLIVAQSTAEEIKKVAYQKAETIIKEAEMKASKMIEEANSKVLQITYEYGELKKRYQLFLNKFRNLLQTELSALEMVDKELQND
ncbi:cell division initiation protein [Caldicellulosiruptor bescii]|jgi:cell division initiation protein|uniref:DivIVA domain protein n=8 Tax=Caldicellulosiruptor TaxID=44000 RepID=E4Q1G8_CALOW|nr:MULTISPECIES: DivIVA domain-containing protein [Caldicellulosiruptor]ACM60448.1 DivIVA family protein [Caldicellulosiruptor bescii DSM 6725]ADL42501.1 DivIVA domain [Caldicellulosiruptor obsidiansis OB47]ADQ04702.1 DivIVA domain protein [Caldicellulosiruptor owensensis OL]ADQ40842.1 DivIVA domain [Caldicellulosiruptor acetigenus I77R1B]ADQ46209.1 DivIVA domain [Caldicellulosiruptor kronotskyensis 2002]